MWYNQVSELLIRFFFVGIINLMIQLVIKEGESFGSFVYDEILMEISLCDNVRGIILVISP